jgi:Holliday junction resolvasome RuvABC endonuclease subunit
MKKQYDFSKGVRGKFYRPNAVLKIPVYLDKEVQTFVEGIAESKKSDVATVVNDLLKSDMRLADVIR